MLFYALSLGIAGNPCSVFSTQLIIRPGEAVAALQKLLSFIDYVTDQCPQNIQKHLHSQTVWAKDQQVKDNVLHPLCVTC